MVNATQKKRGVREPKIVIFGHKHLVDRHLQGEEGASVDLTKPIRGAPIRGVQVILNVDQLTPKLVGGTSTVVATSLGV